MRRALLRWYRRSARALPWRATRDPYRVWVSEILLQQTRVETALPYYERFVDALPTVDALAAAPLDRVLRLWAGVGYYGRARRLHEAARVVVRERGGRFPSSSDEWQRLPGIGRYTAGAMASIVSGEPTPAVDGNVKRVLARLYGIEASIDAGPTQADLWRRAALLVARRSPGDFNQAMMELGARVCTARRPACAACPLRRWCVAWRDGLQDRLPVRSARRPVPRVDAVGGLVCEEDRCLLVRRLPTGLLGGLWTLPGGELRRGENHGDALRRHLRAMLGVEVEVGKRLAAVRHEFSHRRLRIHVYRCQLPGPVGLGGGEMLRWVSRGRLGRYAMAAVDRKVLAAALPGTVEGGVDDEPRSLAGRG